MKNTIIEYLSLLIEDGSFAIGLFLSKSMKSF